MNKFDNCFSQYRKGTMDGLSQKIGASTGETLQNNAVSIGTGTLARIVLGTTFPGRVMLGLWDASNEVLDATLYDTGVKSPDRGRSSLALLPAPIPLGDSKEG